MADAPHTNIPDGTHGLWGQSGYAELALITSHTWLHSNPSDAFEMRAELSFDLFITHDVPLSSSALYVAPYVRAGGHLT